MLVELKRTNRKKGMMKGRKERIISTLSIGYLVRKVSDCTNAQAPTEGLRIVEEDVEFQRGHCSHLYQKTKVTSMTWHAFERAVAH